MRVAAVTAASSASTSAVRSRSGTAQEWHRRPAGDRINQEAVLGVQCLVARPGVGAGQQAQQLVRSGAADDPLRIERERLAECAAQRPQLPSG